MGTVFVASEVTIKRISNGYLLTWSETFGTQGEGWSIVEYYAQSLEDATQRLKTLFQGN